MNAPQPVPAAPTQAYAPQPAAVSAQPFASQAVPVAAPQKYATQNVTEPQINNAIPDQAPTPSWAKKPGEINTVTTYQQPVQEEK